MLRTVTISFTAAVFFVGVGTANLVCYHPSEDGLNPLSPVSSAAWKE